ncbi:MAG: TetR/AcrR family transcriptional regulator [Mycobacterium sp.]
MTSAGARRTEKLQAILAATERLMLYEGYGSVTYRSVAAKAGVAAGLVQYYFPSLDDLFVAVLRRGTDRVIEGLEEASRSEQPLRALWEYANNRTGTALLMEFMALANHRPIVGDAIGEGGERVRRAVVEAVSTRWPGYGLDEDELPPPALVFMLGAIPRMVHLEEGLGTFTGHAETIALVERFLDRVEPGD